jgi:hypothetical protein
VVNVPDCARLESEREVAFWYGIPHGYHRIDLTPSAERLEAIVGQVRDFPAESQNAAERVLRFYARVATSMQAHSVQACLLGMHPDDQGSFQQSVITVSTMPSQGMDSDLIVAGVAGLGVSENSEVDITPLQLPCGTAFFAQRRRRVPAPGRPVRGGSREAFVWQGTIAVAHLDRTSTVVLQLVTQANDNVEDYRDILVGVAHTLTFADPYATGSDTEQDRETRAQGHAAELMRNDFG